MAKIFGFDFKIIHSVLVVPRELARRPLRLSDLIDVANATGTLSIRPRKHSLQEWRTGGEAKRRVL